MASTSGTPKLIVPEEKSPLDSDGSHPAPSSPVPSTSIMSPSAEGATRKFNKILSTQSSFERHHPPHPIGKRFSIDADPSSIILNTPVTDLSNNPLQQPSTPDVEVTPSVLHGSSALFGKESSPARSPSLKKSDSFLEIPYEKGEIVDLIKLADDPNASAHITNDGQEVLLEHGAAP